MRERHIGALVAAESLATSLAVSIVATVPVVTGGLVYALASRATLDIGSSVVVWPVPVMLWGLIASWGALCFILLVPTLTPLRRGTGTQLRRQEN